jgi:hypothetical protein
VDVCRGITGDRQLTDTGACSKQEPVIRYLARIIQGQHLPAAIDGDNRAPESHLDVLLLDVIRLENPGLPGARDLQKLLRERWALIGQMRLGPNEGNAPFEARLAEHFHCAATGVTGAHDDRSEPLQFHR